MVRPERRMPTVSVTKRVKRTYEWSCTCARCGHSWRSLGDLPPELIAQKESFLKDRVAVEMKRLFKTDFRRIGHATRVARYAERIGKRERGNMAVILAAAYLHDIGIHEAERKHGSAAGKYQEIEGPPIARAILEKLDVEPAVVDHVCLIVANHHSARDIDTPEFRIIWDADWLVKLPEEDDTSDTARLGQRIENIFKTERGRQIARTALLERSRS